MPGITFMWHQQFLVFNDKRRALRHVIRCRRLALERRRGVRVLAPRTPTKQPKVRRAVVLEVVLRSICDSWIAMNWRQVCQGLAQASIANHILRCVSSRSSPFEKPKVPESPKALKTICARNSNKRLSNAASRPRTPLLTEVTRKEAAEADTAAAAWKQ